MNEVLFIHQLNMYWRPGNEMSAGLMMLAHYLTVNTNDSSLQSVFFFFLRFFLSGSGYIHPLHFHDHWASQTQTDGWSQFSKQMWYFRISNTLAHNPQTCSWNSFISCLWMIWKGTNTETHKQRLCRQKEGGGHVALQPQTGLVWE